MHPVDAMLTKWVAPVLKEAGFTKRGRLYVKVRPNGDHSSVLFWIRLGSPLEIWLELGIELRMSRQWLDRDSRLADPGGTNDLPARRAGDEEAFFWQWLPLPPRQFMKHPQVTTRAPWVLSPPGDDMGAAMRELLVSEYLPLMDRVADLDWLAAELRRELRAWPGRVAHCPEGASAAVIPDRRDDPEIDELAAAAAARFPGHDLGPWLAARMVRGDMTGRPEVDLTEPKGSRR